MMFRFVCTLDGRKKVVVYFNDLITAQFSLKCGVSKPFGLEHHGKERKAINTFAS